MHFGTFFFSFFFELGQFCLLGKGFMLVNEGKFFFLNNYFVKYRLDLDFRGVFLF